MQYLACLSSSSSNDKLAFDVGLQEQSEGETDRQAGRQPDMQADRADKHTRRQERGRDEGRQKHAGTNRYRQTGRHRQAGRD